MIEEKKFHPKSYRNHHKQRRNNDNLRKRNDKQIRKNRNEGKLMKIINRQWQSRNLCRKSHRRDAVKKIFQPIFWFSKELLNRF